MNQNLAENTLMSQNLSGLSQIWQRQTTNPIDYNHLRWQSLLDAVSTKRVARLEKADLDVVDLQHQARISTNPNEWCWGELLQTLVEGKKQVPVKAELDPAERWQCKTVRSPGLTLSELIAEINF